MTNAPRGRLRAALGSYRFRVVAGYLAVIVVLAAVWSWSLFGPLTSTVTEQQRSYLTAIARADARALAGERATVGAGPGGEAADAGVAQRAREVVAGTALRLTVVASDGVVLADSQEDSSRMENHAGRPEIAAALAGRVGSDTRISPTQGIPQLYVAVPGTIGGREVAVRVSERLATIDQLTAAARRTGLLALAVALGLAAFLGWRLSRSTAEPVSRLARAALAMSEGDLSVQVPEGGGDLGAVSSALASLRDRVHETISGLESARAMLATVLDGMPDAVFLVDGERVDYANQAVTCLFGAPASGWTGATLGPPEVPASLSAAIGRLLGTPNGGSDSVGPDPLQRYFDITTGPVDVYDGSRRTLVVVADVTDVRRLDAVRRDFVANASHELKTPTAAIELLATSASTAASDGDTDQAMAFVEQIHPEAERLRRLVGDLLDLSRLEAPPAEGTVADVRRAVDDAIAAHRPAARAAGLHLTVDESAVLGQDVYAKADPTDLAIALDNVLSNAIAYTSAGGATVRLRASEGLVTIEVRDTGVGIAPEHLARVFERFYRADPARSRASGGTGLGLSLVRNAVERSGGTASISSEPGSGTTVTLTFERAL